MKGDPVSRALAGAVAAATGKPFEIVSKEPVGGGCIHTALALTGKSSDGERRYFAKWDDADRLPILEAEADGLGALRAAGALPVPRVIALGEDGSNAWLVLEWMDLQPLDAKSAARLGTALAVQHRMAQPRYGWENDNFIGATPQLNEWADDWLPFWRDLRLHAQLRFAARNRLPSRMIERGERLAADCGAFFSNYVPAKSLLHGDLWGGNAAATASGGPAVFDPAVYVGDREADVAMTSLFGGFPAEFLAAYRAEWALDDGYRVRRELYNLYHVLNHANLFAGGYVRQAEHQIEKLLVEIA